MSSDKKQGPNRRRRYAVAAGAVVSSISLASGGAAVAAGLGGPADAQSATTAKVQSAAAQPLSPTPKVDPTQRALDAYFKAGYDYTDAVKLGALWHESPYKAKIQAGNKLLAGGKLPIKHHGGGSTSTRETRELNAFFGAGYTYADAVKLAAIWHTSDPYHAKLRGGGKLLAGGTLPIRP
jgi:hypothetical protein